MKLNHILVEKFVWVFVTAASSIDEHFFLNLVDFSSSSISPVLTREERVHRHSRLRLSCCRRGDNTWRLGRLWTRSSASFLEDDRVLIYHRRKADVGRRKNSALSVRRSLYENFGITSILLGKIVTDQRDRSFLNWFWNCNTDKCEEVQKSCC